MTEKIKRTKKGFQQMGNEMYRRTIDELLSDKTDTAIGSVARTVLRWIGVPITLVMLCSTQLLSEEKAIQLWPDKMPFSTGVIGEEEVTDGGRLRNIQVPAITVYLPPEEKATGTAVIICPGGGYWIEAAIHEGFEVAEWFNSLGVAGIVLKYRLPTSENVTEKDKVALADAQRAVRLVRSRSEEWGIEPDRIGIMGFSAGGHLASTAGTHFDEGHPEAADPIERVSCRPDFMILIYPVVTMDTLFTHMGSRNALLGEHPDENLVTLYSNERQVTPMTPPTFLVHTTDDAAVPVENSVNFYLALAKYDIPAEMHIYGRGKHGFGLNRETGPVLSWPKRCEEWMGEMGLLIP